MSASARRDPRSPAPATNPIVANTASFSHRDAAAPVDEASVAFVVGPERLATGASDGPLSGTTFAVKDLIDVAGTRTGAGNPDRLALARVATAHAPVVAALLGAGADCIGKTVTDEFAFSLSGTNVHYGTPRNPAAPGHVPGGSSSGSASAVAAGQVDVALGTDTGGSVRVPASYCGILGIRTSLGRVDVTGVTPLSPSFDTVGLFARSTALLATALDALLRGAPGPTPRAGPRVIRRLVVATDLLGLTDGGSPGELATALLAAANRLGASAGLRLVEAELAGPTELLVWREAFRTIQMLEAWESDGAWLTEHRPRLGPGIAQRFQASSELDPRRRAGALATKDAARARLAQVLGDDGVLVQPAASGPAPPIELDAPTKNELRARTLTLTAPAGLAGAPVLVLRGTSSAEGPVGLALVGLAGDDEALVALGDSQH